MATPFGGSDTTKWTDFFQRLSHLSHIGSFNKALLDHLKTDSHELKTLGEEFPKWLNNRSKPKGKEVRVICFFEEFATKIGHVVPRESATIPGREELSLSSDHIGICKFDNFEDPKYKLVVGYLKRWIEEIKTVNQENLSISVSPIP